MKAALIRVIAVTAAGTILSRAAAAQGWSLSAVELSSNNATLGKIKGAAVGLRVPRDDYIFRLGIEGLRRREERIGTACSGFVDLSDCQPEPMREEARFLGASTGLGGRLFARGGVTALFTGDVQVARAHADAREHASGRSRSADKFLIGLGVGLEVAWRPRRGVPLAVEAAITTNRLTPVSQYEILDGYTPFDEGFAARRMRVGLSWRSDFVRR